MKYPPRRGRAVPTAVLRPPAAPARPQLLPQMIGGLPRLTPQQASLLPRGARFVGLDGLPRIRQ